jgi:hypothetical protein
MGAFRRAIGAASAFGAVGRVSRNEQVVGSIPTGGSQVVTYFSIVLPIRFVIFVDRLDEQVDCTG